MKYKVQGTLLPFKKLFIINRFSADIWIGLANFLATSPSTLSLRLRRLPCIEVRLIFSVQSGNAVYLQVLNAYALN